MSEVEPEHWERANRELIAKLLTELAFEDVLLPETAEQDDGGAAFTLAMGERIVLRYAGRPRPLGGWRIDPASVTAEVDGRPAPLPGAAELVAAGAPALGADASTTAGLVGEVAMTVRSDAAQLACGRPAAELLDLDPLLLEGEMRGHPWIVASKGRVGFSAADADAYAPEAQQPIALPWLAVDPALAEVRGLDNTTVVREQVGEQGFAELRRRAAAAGIDPAVLLPVHPWQWENRIRVLHAGDLANGRIAHLGALGDRYLAQQSIRTLADAAEPGRRMLKLPVSILNTSVYRGLPRDRTLAAPALTDWLTTRCSADPFLRECGLELLGEVASVSVPHAAFEAIPDVPYQHTELLGAIWREPVTPRLRPGERAITLAALIHSDPAGTPFVEPLIARSGLTVEAWATALHEATLPPLVHVLYRHGTTFSAHAQNCMIVLRDDVPVRLVVKDFIDDMQISAEPIPELADLPPAVRAALGDGVEAPIITQWVWCGLMVCVHRYLAELLEQRLGYPPDAFWAAAERAIAAYQERFADELGDRFALFDFDAPAFVKLCLNRVRLLGRGYADAAERPTAAAIGFLENPLAPREALA